jgi:hypothetical protein
MISAYLESLAGALSFDRSLSRCVRQEVEDHLWEAVAADPISDRLEAERRAIANFGDPHVIAAQFAVVSLAKQTRRVGAAVVLVVAGVFIVMKARIEWYAATQWAISDDMKAVGGIVGLIDRFRSGSRSLSASEPSPASAAAVSLRPSIRHTVRSSVVSFSCVLPRRPHSSYR